MNMILIILLLALMAAVLFQLVRGIIAFLQTSKADLDTPGDGATPMQMKQNSAMFARIKYQALAIVVVAVLLALNS